MLEDINFILHLSYLSDILGVMNNCNCYLQGPGSNILDFAIKLTTSGVGKVRLTSHMRLFDPKNVALYLFARNTEDLFIVVQLHLHPSFPALVWSKSFSLFHPPFASPVRLKTFFCSLTHRWQLFGCSTFSQVAL